jgi:hypothetical protein
MAIRFAIDQQAHVVRTTYVGSVTFTDLVTYVKELVLAGVLGYPRLIDGRAATLLLSPDQTRELAQLMASLRTAFGVAPSAFVTGDEASSEVARRYQALGAGANPAYQVFPDLMTAEHWLAVEGPEH